jgi:hypothetical protein
MTGGGTAYLARIGGRYRAELPSVAYNDASSFTGQWTLYSGLCSDSEDESAAPASNSTIPETGRTRRSASTPHAADHSRVPADLHRHDDLALRLGQSPSASPHYSELVTSGFAPSGVADAEIGISDGFEISSTVVACRPLTVVKETGVPQ